MSTVEELVKLGHQLEKDHEQQLQYEKCMSRKSQQEVTQNNIKPFDHVTLRRRCRLNAGHTLCNFRAISARYQLTLYEKIACDVKPKLTIYVLSLYGPIVERDLCAHYTCEILGFTVANSRETNKQPKQAQYFFYDLLSSILFIISYLLPINEPHIYSLKYIWVILWKCQFFCP